MKKRLSSCLECGDDTSILTQVSGSPEAVLLCTDCYHLKYSHEGQNEINYTEEDKSQKLNKNFLRNQPLYLQRLNINYGVAFNHGNYCR